MLHTYHDSPVFWKRALSQGLKDDHALWDFTSLAAQNQKKKTVTAELIAKAEGVWAGNGIFGAIEQLSHTWRMPIKIQAQKKTGDRVRKKEVIARWEGDPHGILIFERPSINLAAFVSGIATQTGRLVNQISESGRKNRVQNLPRLTSTRKIMPFYRDLSLLGVTAGGGMCHRVSLSGGVLLKENHIAWCGGIVPAVFSAKKTAPHGLKIEVEVRNLDELKSAVKARADVVLLDNFLPDQVETAVRYLHDQKSEMTVEVSGGINEQSIGSYVIEGVHVISSGSLTHSVTALDLSLLIKD